MASQEVCGTLPAQRTYNIAIMYRASSRMGHGGTVQLAARPLPPSPRRLRCRRRRAGLAGRSTASQVPTTGPKPPCGSAAAAATAPPTPLLSAGAGVNVRCGQPEGGCRTVSHPPPSRLSAQISRAGIAARGSCPLPIGLEQPSAERGRPGRGWARGAAARHRPHPHPVCLLQLGDSRPRARHAHAVELRRLHRFAGPLWPAPAAVAASPPLPPETGRARQP